MALAKIVRTDKVEEHPDQEKSAHLSIMHIGDLQGVSMKVDGEGDQEGKLVPRYRESQLVLAIFEGALVPEYLLRRGFWSESEDRGMLAGGGKKKNVMKASKFNGILSQFILYPVSTIGADDQTIGDIQQGERYISGENDRLIVVEGDDVTEFLGITPYKP